MRARVCVIAVVMAAMACDKKTPIAPTMPESPTRVIVLSGDLSFGNVEIGNTWSRTLHVMNTGTAALSVTGINGPFSEAFTVSTTTGTVQPGGLEFHRVAERQGADQRDSSREGLRRDARNDRWGRGGHHELQFDSMVV